MPHLQLIIIIIIIIIIIFFCKAPKQTSRYCYNVTPFVVSSLMQFYSQTTKKIPNFDFILVFDFIFLQKETKTTKEIYKGICK